MWLSLSNEQISKHLMLLFNEIADQISDFYGEFQNISCYCLTSIGIP